MFLLNGFSLLVWFCMQNIWTKLEYIEMPHNISYCFSLFQKLIYYIFLFFHYWIIYIHTFISVWICENSQWHQNFPLDEKLPQEIRRESQVSVDHSFMLQRRMACESLKLSLLLGAWKRKSVFLQEKTKGFVFSPQPELKTTSTLAEAHLNVYALAHFKFSSFSCLIISSLCSKIGFSIPNDLNGCTDICLDPVHWMSVCCCSWKDIVKFFDPAPDGPFFLGSPLLTNAHRLLPFGCLPTNYKLTPSVKAALIANWLSFPI